MAFDSTIALPSTFAAEQVQVIDEFAREVFINETPFLARLRRRNRPAIESTILSYEPRPKTVQVNDSDGLTTGDTGLVLDDATYLQEGDLLETPAGELLRVTAIVSGAQVTVHRAEAGTTAATMADNAVLTLRGNARFGNEKNLHGLRAPRTAATQWAQRMRYDVTIAQRTIDYQGTIIQPNGRDVLSQYREEQLVNMERDTEDLLVWGRGVAPSGSEPSKMHGFRRLIKQANVTTSPTNATAYTPDDLVRDVFGKAQAGGGAVDVCFVSSGWTEGLHKWGYTKVQITTPGATVNLGIDITGYVFPFNGRTVTFIPCPLLVPPGGADVAIGLTFSEVYLSVGRGESWFPTARQGESQEGYWVFDGCPELENPAHHAMVSGITGFGS